MRRFAGIARRRSRRALIRQAGRRIVMLRASWWLGHPDAQRSAFT